MNDTASTIINVASFGLKPNTGENAVHAVKKCIEALAEADGPCVLEFPNGQYDFFPCELAKEKYYISNTATEDENPDITKTIGILFKDKKNLTVEGNGSLFMFHGKMTMFAADNCENIEIRNVITDFVRPTISEMTVEAIKGDCLEVRVHPDSWYVIEDEKLYWVGEGWKFVDGPSQEFNPDKNTVWRVENPVSSAIKVEEINPFHLRLYYQDVPQTKNGHVYQMRDGIRDQVGILLLKSKNISFDQVHIRYMHGLGIVGQFSENLRFNKMNLSPDPKSNRTAAAFADFMHMSGVRGEISITDSHFEGAHDDAINVHGTHLGIVDQPAANQLVVRFMHGQSYGFDAFFTNDTIEFLRSDSLTVYTENKVERAKPLNPREILLTLEQNVHEEVKTGDVIENVSWAPEVKILSNHFSRIPTRGVLMTTPKKVLIKDNVFEGMFLSGILVACDAKSWFESGRVNDLEIIQNKFIECGANGDPVIFINPENTVYDWKHPVHKNILIEGNQFTLLSNTVLYAKSTQNVAFIRNLLEGSQLVMEEYIKPLIHLSACSGVEIAENNMNTIRKSVLLEYMSEDNLSISGKQGLKYVK